MPRIVDVVCFAVAAAHCCWILPLSAAAAAAVQGAEGPVAAPDAGAGPTAPLLVPAAVAAGGGGDGGAGDGGAIVGGGGGGRGGGLIRPSPDGRRRPLLGLRTIAHAAQLQPFAARLGRHLARSALQSRAAEMDFELLDVLLGAEFLSVAEAQRQLAAHVRA